MRAAFFFLLLESAATSSGFSERIPSICAMARVRLAMSSRDSRSLFSDAKSSLCTTSTLRCRSLTSARNLAHDNLSAAASCPRRWPHHLVPKTIFISIVTCHDLERLDHNSSSSFELFLSWYHGRSPQQQDILWLVIVNVVQQRCPFASDLARLRQLGI